MKYKISIIAIILGFLWYKLAVDVLFIAAWPGLIAQWLGMVLLLDALIIDLPKIRKQYSFWVKLLIFVGIIALILFSVGSLTMFIIQQK